MAEKALGPGTRIVPRRAFFGLLDAGGWGWATLKAIVWMVLLILLLGYLPDRALYATVQPTIDIGFPIKAIAPALDVTPVNLCPASNRSLPCPAPLGAPFNWQPSPAELALPAPRTLAGVVQAGAQTLLIGGSDGTAPQSTVFATTIHADGNFDKWAAGPALPAPRADATVAFLSGTVYVIGGLGADGKPTDTVWSGSPDATTGSIATWTPEADLKLPAPRAGAAVAVAPDGLFLLGGTDGTGPTATVWKATLNTVSGKLSKWADQPPMASAGPKNTSVPEPRVHASAVVLGSYLFVYGGETANAPTNVTLRATIGAPAASAGAAASASAAPSAAPSGSAPANSITGWATSTAANLPAARVGAVGFNANGTLYYLGGAGQGPNDDFSGEVYWATPDAGGNINGWTHVVASDLPKGQDLQHPAPIVSGSSVFLIGGTTAGQGILTGSAQANLAALPPYFQVGLFYVVVPALGIQGAVGQQLSYLAAAGVGTVDFVLLVLAAWAFNHPARAREMLGRLRRRRHAGGPTTA